MEDTNRNNVIRRLLKNDFSPISITQIKTVEKKKRDKKNKISSTSVEKTIGTQKKNEKLKKLTLIKNKVSNGKITIRDVIIFTQKFYLLKKANFNNIHALSTISEGVENLEFKEIIEDILAGVEAR